MRPSHVSLEFRNLLDRLEIAIEITRQGIGPFERCARRHVEDQELFDLVVLGKLLDPHAPRQHEQDAADKQQHDQKRK